MTQAQATDSFLQLLERSKLLTAAQVRQAVEEYKLDRCPDARSAAGRLVAERVITPFQAERLLEGRYRGFVIDRYKVREILGVGGMGCIYIAEDMESRKKVALKILASQHELDPGMLARLEMEARAGMTLDHPNIVKTYRMDSTGAVTFMVMELVRGVSLHELIAINGPVAPSMAASIIRQVALGLHAAHQRGIIHRDVKPANVLISPDGTAQILDFGLALMADDPEAEFSLAMIFGHDCLGTPDFISPEQSLDSSAVDATTDIYSLGGTMYLALTGRLPFPQKSTAAKLEGHRTRSPRDIRELRPEVPAELAAIVHRMLAKEPRDRYQSAAEVAAALEPFAKQRNLHFDFRKIITLRARQAHAKRDQARPAAARSRNSSLITGSSAMWNRSVSGVQAEIETGLHREDTPPAVSENVPPRPPIEYPTPLPPPTAVEAATTPVPAGWFLRPRAEGSPAVPLRKSRVVIGRTGGCDIVLDSRGISGQHCELTWAAGHWTVRDLASRNGTLVNRKRVDHWVLDPGDELGLGENTAFILDNGSTSSKPSAPWLPFVLVGVAAVALVVVLYLVFA